MADRKPPLGGMILLHASAADPTAPCVYCGKAQPWADMEPCDGPAPLRAEIERLRKDRDRLRGEVMACVPQNWLDPMLTGPKHVLERGNDIEQVLNAVRERIVAVFNRSATSSGQASPNGGTDG